MATIDRLKNHLREIQIFQRRAKYLLLFIAIACLGLLSRVIFLQVSQHQRYAKLSQHNILDLVPIPSKRGLIYDQNGVILADNQPSFNLILHPNQIHDLEASLTQLQTVIPLTDSDITSAHKQLKHRKPFQAVPLKLKLSEREMAMFAVNQYRFPGITLDASLIRRYPLTEIMAPVIGYVGRFSDNDRSLLANSNYVGTELIGKLGIEQTYEDALHGQIGYQRLEVNARGKPVRSLDRHGGTAGNQLVLAIDSQLQKTGYDAFGKHRGAAVAIDPNNGEILALISHPSFDPNPFVSGIDHKRFNALTHAAERPLFNRALRGQFPFASTIKPFLALHALDQGVITPKTKIRDPGFFTLPHSIHRFRDWKPGGHGNVDVRTAIIVSCDTFFYKLAVLLGIDQIDETLNQYGFGHMTGIDIAGERPGLVPTPIWKRSHQHQPWFPGDTVITGIGQGFLLATPLQLAQATATLANHGQGYRPHLVRNEILASGQVKHHQPEALPPITIDPGHWQTVTNAMHGVIVSVNPWGTGKRFGLPDYPIAAKTGTAQLYHSTRPYREDQVPEKLRDHSLFIGFAPINHPKIAVAVVVENSPVAPNVARKIIDQFFTNRPEFKHG